MGDQQPPAHRWWQTRGFVVAMALLAMLPLLWPDIPPLVDLPGHMGRYRVQLDLHQYQWLTDWYDFNWSLIGNLGVDLLVELLGRVLGLELAVKLIVLTIPPLIVVGLLGIAREVHGRIPATALFALPIAYCYPFQFGFVNFALSMAIALPSFALWLRLARLDRVGLRAIIFVPLSCALWICHTFGWGVLGVLAFSAEMVREHDRRTGTGPASWLKSWVRAAIGCLPLALPLVLMIVWRSGQHVTGETADWFNWQAKTTWLTMILRDRWMAFDLGSTAVLGLVLYRGFRDPNLEYSRNLGLSALFLMAVFLVLPRIVFGSAYADMRLAPFMIAIALVAIRPRPILSPRGAARLAMLGLAFVLVRTGGTTISYWLFDQRYDRELAALDHVPPGARLVSFVGENCRNDWLMTRLEHLPALALERRMAYTNDQWSMAGAQLLTTKYRVARGFAHDPSQIVTSVQCPREWWRPISRSLARFPRAAFDYVWLIQPPAFDPRFAAGLVPIWRSGSSVLYKVDHGQPGPQVSDAELRWPGLAMDPPRVRPVPVPRDQPLLNGVNSPR